MSAMQQRVILREHSVVVSSCPSRLADFSKYPLHSLSVPPARIYPSVLLASEQARSWFHADGRANELWGTHRHVLGGLLIKLGNNEWTNTPAVSTLVYIPRVSYVPLSFHLLTLSISLLSSHLIPYGGVPRICVQAKAHHGGVGYQTRSRLPSAGFSFFLSSFRSFSLFIFLFSLPLSAYLFPSFITVLSFSFSLFLHISSSPVLSLSLFLFLYLPNVGSHLGECVASSNAPSRITINYLLRYLSPSTSRPVLRSAIYMVSGWCVASHCARKWKISTASGARTDGLTLPSVSSFRDFPSFPLFHFICSAISRDVSIRTYVRLVASKSIER